MMNNMRMKDCTVMTTSHAVFVIYFGNFVRRGNDFTLDSG